MYKVTDNGTISITRGDTAYLTVDILDDAGATYEMQPGDTLTMTVKRNFTDAEPCLQKIIEGENQFHLTPFDTKDMEFGKYKYDIQLNTVDGDVFTIVGPQTFEILYEVTC